MCKQIIGLLRLFFHLCNPRNISTLNKIVDRLIDSRRVFRKKLFVLTVGFSKSGKTSLVESNETLKKLFKLSSDEIHDQLNYEFSFLKDDNTIYGKAYWERQYLTRLVRKKALNKLFSLGYGVVNDSANLNRQERKQRLRIAKKHGYKTVIVWVTCEESILLKRLQDADNKSVEHGGNRVWVDQYKNVQKKRFNPPISAEADEVLIFESSTENANTLF